jgi:hypothetical protein
MTPRVVCSYSTPMPIRVPRGRLCVRGLEPSAVAVYVYSVGYSETNALGRAALSSFSLRGFARGIQRARRSSAFSFSRTISASMPPLRRVEVKSERRVASSLIVPDR